MTQNSKIYAPNVYLFAYHLCKPPETESSSPVELTKLWEKCNEILQAKLAVGKPFNGSYLSKKDEPLGWRVDLINKQVVGGRNSLPFAKDISHDNQQINLKGFAEPLRIDDSYALGLKIRIPEKLTTLKRPLSMLASSRNLIPITACYQILCKAISVKLCCLRLG